MTVFSIYVESNEEKEELVKLLKETIALYTLVYGVNVRAVDVIKEALRHYNQSLRVKLQLKQ